MRRRRRASVRLRAEVRHRATLHRRLHAVTPAAVALAAITPPAAALAAVAPPVAALPLAAAVPRVPLGCRRGICWLGCCYNRSRARCRWCCCRRCCCHCRRCCCCRRRRHWRFVHRCVVTCGRVGWAPEGRAIADKPSAASASAHVASAAASPAAVPCAPASRPSTTSASGVALRSLPGDTASCSPSCSARSGVGLRPMTRCAAACTRGASAVRRLLAGDATSGLRPRRSPPRPRLRLRPRHRGEACFRRELARSGLRQAC